MVAGKVLCGLDYVIEGRENIPATPSVVMIKHSSVFEAYAQTTIFPEQAWVLKRELFWIPVFGWGLARMKPIAINRKAGRSAVKQVIRQGKDRLARGIWVTVFPRARAWLRARRRSTASAARRWLARRACPLYRLRITPGISGLDAAC